MIIWLTLRTRELPEFFGGVFDAIRASPDAAYRVLITKVVRLYQRDLFNPHWGEQMAFRSDNTLRLAMVFQGLDKSQAEKVWAPSPAAMPAGR